MPAGNAREALKLLERLAVDHLGWLMRVHCALMFPEQAPPPPCDPESPLPALCAALCGDTEVLVPLSRQRVVMLARGRELMEGARRRGCADPDAYRDFMAAVDSYAREARRAEAHFRRQLVETDPLTGIHNRQGMLRDIRREWTRALRTGRPCCLAVADLDFFKHVNDTYGHAAGDKVLCMAARFFVRRLRPYDLVFRYGGEEFLFCLPDTDADMAWTILDRLRGLMARLPVVLDCGTRVPVTCSIGVAQMAPGRSVQETIAAADRALYAAKEAGRNRVAVAPMTDDPQGAAPGDIAARLHPMGSVRH